MIFFKNNLFKKVFLGSIRYISGFLPTLKRSLGIVTDAHLQHILVQIFEYLENVKSCFGKKSSFII